MGERAQWTNQVTGSKGLSKVCLGCSQTSPNHHSTSKLGFPDFEPVPGAHWIKNLERSADWLMHQFEIVISKLVACWLVLNFYLWYLPRFGFEDLNFVNLYDEDCVVDDLNDVHFDEDDFMQF